MSLILTLVMAVSAGKLGEATVVLSPAGVTVKAFEAPLGRLVQQFAAVARIDASLVDSRVQGYPVSVALENVPLAYALRATLEAAGVSFVVWGDEPPTLRVAAYPRDDSGKPAPPPPPPAPDLSEYEDILGPPPGTPPPPPVQPTEEDLEILGPPPTPAPPPQPQNPSGDALQPKPVDAPQSKPEEGNRKTP